MEGESYILKAIGIIADIVTISGVTFLTIWSFIRRERDVIAFRVSLFLSYLLRVGFLIILCGIVFLFASEPYLFSLALLKGHSNGELWENGKELHHIAAYIFTGAISLSIVWIFGTILWTSSTKYALDFFNLFIPGRPFKFKLHLNPKLEILSAIYGSDTNTVNLTDVLRRMINDEKLDIVINNSLGGDPHPGIVKKLTVTYRKGALPISIVVGEGETLTIG